MLKTAIRVMLAVALCLAMPAYAVNAPAYSDSSGQKHDAQGIIIVNPDGSFSTPATPIPNVGSPTKPGGLVGTSSAQLIASGSRVYFFVQNVSASAFVACNWGGTAILNDAGSFMLGPMGSKTYEGSYVPSAALNCISDTASTPVYAEVK